MVNRGENIYPIEGQKGYMVERRDKKSIPLHTCNYLN